MNFDPDDLSFYDPAVRAARVSHMSPFVSITRAAMILGVEMVRRWQKAGKMPAQAQSSQGIRQARDRGGNRELRGL